MSLSLFRNDGVLRIDLCPAAETWKTTAFSVLAERSSTNLINTTPDRGAWVFYRHVQKVFLTEWKYTDSMTAGSLPGSGGALTLLSKKLQKPDKVTKNEIQLQKG